MKLIMESWRKYTALEEEEGFEVGPESEEADIEAPEEAAPEEASTGDDFCTNYPDACAEAYADSTSRKDMPQIPNADEFEDELGAPPGEGLETNEPEKIPDIGQATKDYLNSSDDHGKYPTGDQVAVTEESGVDPSVFKPTQKDIYMSNALKKVKSAEDPGNSWTPWADAVLVSKDNYLLDGHHRWAATIIYNEKHPDDQQKMSAQRVGMNIGELLKVANAYHDASGFTRATGGETTV